MAQFSRRDFLNISATLAASVTVSTAMSGCQIIKSNNLYKEPINTPTISFNHGIASGDPLSDKVIIWTRVTPSKSDATDEISVIYEVSKESSFKTIFRSGISKTSVAQDFTVKVDIQDLEAQSEYYYRFRVGSASSIIGKTKTLPKKETDIEKAKFAIVCCANYPAGYFNVYTEVNKMSDIELVLHIGDYIYDYGMLDSYGEAAYATDNAKEIGRVLPAGSDTETITLRDYRNRYALYKTDPDVRNIHQNLAFICIWDDHEIADNSSHDGAVNHNENPSSDEGAFSDRKAAGLQAYFEWLPIRPISEGDTTIGYRSFDFGNLLSLHMLDTRLVARDKQHIITEYLSAKSDNLGYDREKMIAEMYDDNHHLLGEDQFQFLENSVKNSSAYWQVLGQQVLMAKMRVPNEMLLQFGSFTFDGKFLKNLVELSELKARALINDPTLTQEEKQRIDTGIAYNLDAWDGYSYDRERLYAMVKKYKKNLVVYAGDSHNAWSSDLIDDNNEQIGVEFATASITSPGMERFLGGYEIADFRLLEGLLVTLIKDLKYCNLSNRGFMVTTYTKEKVSNDWIYVNTIKSRDYKTKLTRKKSLTTYYTESGGNKLSTGADKLLKETLPEFKDALFNSLF